MSGRIGPIDSAHKVEAASLVLWHPEDGTIDAAYPEPSSPLRIEAFSAQIQRHYVDRYKGLPPHDVDEPEVDEENEAEKETSEAT